MALESAPRTTARHSSPADIPPALRVFRDVSVHQHVCMHNQKQPLVRAADDADAWHAQTIDVYAPLPPASATQLPPTPAELDAHSSPLSNRKKRRHKVTVAEYVARPQSLASWAVSVKRKNAQDSHVTLTASETARPIVIWVHGGAWVGGSKSQANTRECAKVLAHHGYVVASVEYRACSHDWRLFESAALVLLGVLAIWLLAASTVVMQAIWLALFVLVLLTIVWCELASSTSTQTLGDADARCTMCLGTATNTAALGKAQGESSQLAGPIAVPTDRTVRYPDPVYDVTAAIRYMHRHGAEYGGDTERIFVIGHSAGAHLSACALMDDRFFEQLHVPRSVIKGFVGICGVFSAEACRRNTLLSAVTRDAFGTSSQAQLARCMPADLVRLNPFASALPPTLLLTANYDYGLHQHSLALRQSLRAVGAPVHLEQVADVTHFSIIAHWRSKHLPIAQRIHAFMQHVLASA